MKMAPERADIEFLQAALPRLGLRWPGFRKVRGQVLKRIKRRLQVLHLQDLAGYAAYLDAHPAEWGVLDQMCRISISRFYRDKGVFATLRETILPELAEQVRASDATVLRCWSAGCASGEEAYTVQLLWHLCLAGKFPDVQLEIMATDADPHLIERARQGRYSRGSLKDLPPRWLEAGFERYGDDDVVRDTFRERIGFAAQDIRYELPAGPFHLVLCRNLVLIYFADPVQRAVLTRIATRLTPGGILLVGKHETLPSDCPNFVPCADRQGFFRKVDAATATPAATT
jgi:chemotaxis protein methyltransferase CheR